MKNLLFYLIFGYILIQIFMHKKSQYFPDIATDLIHKNESKDVTNNNADNIANHEALESKTITDESKPSIEDKNIENTAENNNAKTETLAPENLTKNNEIDNLYQQGYQIFKDRESVKAKNNQNLVQIETLNKDDEGILERSLTKALTSFVNSNSGQNFTKNFLSNDLQQIGVGKNFAADTASLNSMKLKYSVLEISSGSGYPCICGDEVEVMSDLADDNSKSVKREKTNFVVGLHKYDEFNHLVHELKTGATVVSKFNNTKDPQDNKLRYLTLTLLKNNTVRKFDYEKVKIFDSIISDQPPVECNKKIIFNIKIDDASGNHLTNTKLSYTLGDQENFPQVLSYMLSNIPYTGKRTVILPAKYLKSEDNKFVNSSISDDAYLVIELSNISALNM